MQPPLLSHTGVKLLSLLYTPSTDALHLLFKTQHHLNSCLAQLQTIVYSRFLVVFILFFFNHMSILNFNPAPNYLVFLAMALKKKGTGVMIQSPSIFESLDMWYSRNIRCSIPYLHFLQVILILRLILSLIFSLRFLPLLMSQLIPSPTSLLLLIPPLMSLLQPILPSTSLLSLPLLRILSTLLLLSPITLIR
jgi:hypothetical protein